MRPARRNIRTAAAVAALLLAVAGCRPRRGTGVDSYAFVAAAGSSALAVVDLANFSVARQIPLGVRPTQVVSDARRKLVYVMGEGGPAGLTVVDARKLEVKQRCWLAEKPQRMRLSGDGRDLYILDAGAQLFKSFNLEKMAHDRQIRLDGPPVDFDVSPDGHWACISLHSGAAVIVDLAHWRVAGEAQVGGEPEAVAIRHDSRQAFVANRSERLVSVIDLASGKLVAQLRLNARPEALRFKPDGGELFVSGGDSSAVIILSAYRDEIDEPMLAGVEPRDMAITRDNHLLFVSNSAANTVSVLNIDDRRPLASVPVGEKPDRVALTPDDQYALVLNRGSGDMAVIRVAAVTRGGGRTQPFQPLFTMIRVGSEPVDLAVQNK
jgi:YVTN family beta-propeller protein